VSQSDLTGLKLRLISELTERQQPNGGFSNNHDETARPDATAWALTALQRTDFAENRLNEGREYLTQFQSLDGRISLSKENDNITWITPISLLAWGGHEDFLTHRTKAEKFLLSVSGEHFVQKGNALGFDTSIRGWPWILSTHSWVDSTAYAILALRSIKALVTPLHPRIDEAVNMLMDRQLESGGWNYGNTSLFGVELRPTMESTALAMTALNNLVESKKLKLSYNYLIDQIQSNSSMLSLSWAVIALRHTLDSEQLSLLLKSYFDQIDSIKMYPTEWISIALIAHTSTQNQSLSWDITTT